MSNRSRALYLIIMLAFWAMLFAWANRPTASLPALDAAHRQTAVAVKMLHKAHTNSVAKP